jgi:hypothetical protein
MVLVRFAEGDVFSVRVVVGRLPERTRNSEADHQPPGGPRFHRVDVTYSAWQSRG